MVDIQTLKNSIPKPNWMSWKNKSSVTLNQALLLCMNVCPKWYEVRDDKEKFLSNLTVWGQYRLQLEDAQSWASRVDWVNEYLAEVDLQEDDYVDLKKFARWACQDVEWQDIPNDFKKLAGIVDISEVEPEVNIQHVHKQLLQEQKILEIFTNLNINPLKLSKVESGKAGEKAKVRNIALQDKKLFGSTGVFDKAWNRLMSDQRIIRVK